MVSEIQINKNAIYIPMKSSCESSKSMNMEEGSGSLHNHSHQSSGSKGRQKPSNFVNNKNELAEEVESHNIMATD